MSNSKRKRPNTKRSDASFPFIRAAILTVTLYLSAAFVDSVSIPQFGVTLQRGTMLAIAVIVHVVALCYGFPPEGARRFRGWLYETASCLLPSELVLLLYFARYRLIIAIALLGLLLLGLIALLLYERNMPSDYSRISRIFVEDTAAPGKSKENPYYFSMVSVRRYLVIVSALLLLVPSVLTLTVYRSEGAQAMVGAHATVNTNVGNVAY